MKNFVGIAEFQIHFYEGCGEGSISCFIACHLIGQVGQISSAQADRNWRERRGGFRHIMFIVSGQEPFREKGTINYISLMWPWT